MAAAGTALWHGPQAGSKEGTGDKEEEGRQQLQLRAARDLEPSGCCWVHPCASGLGRVGGGGGGGGGSGGSGGAGSFWLGAALAAAAGGQEAEGEEVSSNHLRGWACCRSGVACGGAWC